MNRMDEHNGKGHALFPKPLTIAKVLTPIKYKRNVIRIIEEMGSIEPIEVDPRIGADEVHVEERRVLMESYKSSVDQYLAGLDHTRFMKNSKITIGPSESDVQKFVTNMVKERSKRLKEILDKKSDIDERIVDLEHIREILKKMDSLNITDSSMLSSSQHTRTFFGTIFPTQIERYYFEISEITDNKYYMVDNEIDPETTAMAILVMRNDEDAVETKLKTLNFNEIMLPKEVDIDSRSIEDCNMEIKELEYELEKLNMELDGIASEMGHDLLATKELIEIELQRISIEKKMRRTTSTCVLWAWIPDDKQAIFSDAITVATEESATIDFRSGQFDPKNSPSYVTNKKFLGGFRSLVTAFGTPNMHEIDPYRFLLFLFPIFFGVMFADAGHGIILTLLGWHFTRKKKKMDEAPKGLSSFIYGGSELMIVMGLTSIVFGIAFNSFLGDETILWQVPIFKTIFQHNTWSFFFTVDEVTHEIERNYLNFLLFSFALGAITIIGGLVINIYQLSKYRHSDSDLHAGWTLLGIYVFAIVTFVGGTISPIILWIGLILTFVMLFATVIIEKKAHGTDGVMLSVDHIISLMTSTFSFGRLLAMNTIHFVLAWLPYLFLQLAVEEKGLHVLNHSTVHWAVASNPWSLALWIVGAIIGAFIVVPVETVFSSLQALRLNWVEFFGKFYKGNGIKFTPVNLTRHFTVEEM